MAAAGGQAQRISVCLGKGAFGDVGIDGAADGFHIFQRKVLAFGNGFGAGGGVLRGWKKLIPRGKIICENDNVATGNGKPYLIGQQVRLHQLEIRIYFGFLAGKRR
jgi:hypothetical protein